MELSRCFVCENEDKNVIAFTEESFQKCSDMVAFRDVKKYKYGDLQLTPDALKTHGYHLQCYRKVVTVKEKLKDEYKAFEKQRRKDSLRQSLDSSSTPKEACKNPKDFPSTSSVRQEEFRDDDDEPNEPTADQQNTETSVETDLDDIDIFEVNESNTGSPDKLCIFCSKRLLRVSSRYDDILANNVPLLIVKFRRLAEAIGDDNLIDKLNEQDVIYYHRVCRLNFHNKVKKYLPNVCNSIVDETSWSVTRNIHKQAFDIFMPYLLEQVVEKENIFYLTDIFKKYKAVLLEIASEIPLPPQRFDYLLPHHLEKKILMQYVDQILITGIDKIGRKKLVYKHGLSSIQLLQNCAAKNSEQTAIEEVAFDIRLDVKNMEINSIKKFDPETIIKGECDIPTKLLNFMSALIKGPNYRKKNSEKNLSKYDVKLNSICDDIIYVISKGTVKPAKHLLLGMSIKSLTNSRKVLTILNRLGHCVSYNTAEEFETEMTYTAYNNNKLIPASIIPKNNLSTHVAFDNYDRFVETLNGKDTLHDTVGIIYQFISTENELNDTVSTDHEIDDTVSTEHETDNRTNDTPSTSTVNNITKPPRKKRRFDEVPRTIVPYNKKPKAVVLLHPLDTTIQTICSNNGTKEYAIMRDILWALSFKYIENTPLWVGFNANTIIDNSEIQIIDYLPQINSSPTSYSVVHETLRKAQQIAQECDQDNIIVTYDLGIARMAYQIQVEDAETFKNVFVNMGAFHIEMAFFKTIGKYINECGITDIFVQCDALAAGSVNGFIEGKHFNRCKRLHTLMSAALESLHFERFMKDHNLEVDETIIEELKSFQTKSEGFDHPVSINIELKSILDKYRKYRSKTLDGDHGKTAQLYLQYIEFINLYLRFSRSVRLADFQLYIDSIFQMIDLFFIFNQQNYARWLQLYLKYLIDIKNDNSPLYQEFLRGAFGVKRTNKSIARAPVDLTVEQTINGDAANSLSGISHFTNSISARQRWALSHSLRMKIIRKLMENIKFTCKDDVTQDLHKNRIIKDRQSFNNIVKTIRQNINPFDKDLDADELYHIVTGRAAKTETCNFLLNVISNGKNQKEQFINECSVDGKRLEEPIKRNKIYNFSTETLKKVLKKDDKHIIVKMERDFFGRLLAIALTQEIDIEYCLSFPLGPAPPALCHVSGDMNKTEKSALGHKLKSLILPSIPTTFDVIIIDGFYLLHRLGPLIPATFGKLSELILKKICHTDASQIHFIFDRYFSPSIKDHERSVRQCENTPYTISGALQRTPNNFYKNLKNYRFKDAIVNFLSEHWTDNDLIHIMNNKKIFSTVEDKCFSYEVNGSTIKKTEESTYQCFHEEADTRIIFHINKCLANSKISIQASDTDILIVLLGNYYKFMNLKIWLQYTQKNNDILYYNCLELAQELGEKLCRSLPGFHAYTGSDYTAAFFKKGKIKPFNLLKKNPQLQDVFTSLINPTDVTNLEKVVALQEFTVQLYNVKNCATVNAARFALFQRFFAANNTNGSFLNNLKNFNSCLIPPCWRSLEQKILRTIFVNSMWQNATEQNCIIVPPEGNGWTVEDNILKPFWFTGSSLPQNVADILLDRNISNGNDENDGCVNHNDDDDDDSPTVLDFLDEVEIECDE